MCLLEVAKSEKCRSSHFQLEGGVKSLKTGGGGVKIFRTGGLPIWGELLLQVGQYPITCHAPSPNKMPPSINLRGSMYYLQKSNRLT